MDVDDEKIHKMKPKKWIKLRKTQKLLQKEGNKDYKMAINFEEK